jgi:hypothetical protein
MKRSTLIALILALFAANPLSADETWDILDKSMAAYNADGWTLSKGSNITSGSGFVVTQETGYVNIHKTAASFNNRHLFLIPTALTLAANTAYTFEIKARMQAINKDEFPDTPAPTSAGQGSGGFESNQISARLGNKTMAVHIKYGTEGCVSPTAVLNPEDINEKRVLNTTEWHTYRCVLSAEYSTYTVDNDGGREPVLENVATGSLSGSSIIKLGSESYHRCNMDIEYVKMATGDLTPSPTALDAAPAANTVSYTVNNGLLTVEEADAYTVYSISGQKTAEVTNNTAGQSVSLTPGVYVVKTNTGAALKVIVN